MDWLDPGQLLISYLKLFEIPGTNFHPLFQDDHSETVLAQLNQLARPEALSGMARFGVCTDHALGISMPELRRVAGEVRRAFPRRDPALHALASDLWESGIHEARLVAALVDLPVLVSGDQMERWAAGFNSWDIVDQTCAVLFVETPFAREKALAWSARPEEYVKRAGFVLMAELAVHGRHLADQDLADFLPSIEREAGDGRNFVRKAVNWALRQIGKRSTALNQQAVDCARRIAAQGTRSARWIASDALRELSGPAVQARLNKRSTHRDRRELIPHDWDAFI